MNVVIYFVKTETGGRGLQNKASTIHHVFDNMTSHTLVCHQIT